MKWDTYHTKEIKEKYVYRYLTIEKLVDFLETNSIYLARLDKFEDNLENIEPYDINELKVRSETLSKPDDANPEISDSQWDEMIRNNILALRHLQKSLDQKQKHRFVSCWILNDVESFAMWDIYGKSGFVLRFEQEYFQKLIKESIKLQKDQTAKIDLLIAGTVQYQNYDKMLFKEKESLLKFSAFRKHIAFKHETEYRIVGFMKEILDLSGLKFILPELKDLKFDIIANPRLDSFQFAKYKSMISKYSENHPLKESELKRWLDFRNTTY
ncbi:DUF2971 domain-containing protein [Aurantibacter crassamenti]|uniref:DUF2971 domain-containing protein n=1 Tax=Aurantibacter crassamenti TaxID=1837375 RepID=UPI0019399AD9|nr:DUF2971 domain-containing protein [Aurantibacter crassamenti]MBM1107069.1 DUF2971 domain-containing protein [Aurantibacter crassamenti]